MPIKYNLTKYYILSTRIKKVSLKKAAIVFTADDRTTMIKAILIASFASGHSWQTFRSLTQGLPMRNPEIKKEFADAVASKWKSITPFDIVEVSTTNVSDSVFSEWLFFNVEKDFHQEYKDAWSNLKNEFEEDCDVIERNE